MGYSIKQKIDICLMAETNPDMTQSDLASWAKSRYGSSKPPSQTTISRILSKKDELIALKEHEFKLIRRRRLSNPLLRKVLLEWISQCVWNNIPITAPIIISSASNFWKQLPLDRREGTGEFSYKWCSQFLSKVNIDLHNIEKELYNRLKIWTFEERDDLKLLLENFDPKKIFTLNEIFISHDLPLDKSYYVDKSDFLTCMLCVNVDGSEKFDPLIIGRYENYPSFEGKSSIKASTKHGVSYHSNRKKWLTSNLFYDWLSVLDKRLALTNRDIVIILDDSASHRVINIKLQRIRLLFTSSSSNFLPMGWGIENDFRLIFRTEQYKNLITKQSSLNGSLLTRDQLQLNMAETFDLIKSAWLKVSTSRIQSSWKQSGILPSLMTEFFPRRRMFDDQLEVQLFHLIDEFKVNLKWDVLSLLDLSIEKKTNNAFLSNVEIIQSCIVDNYDDFDHTNGQIRRAPFSHTLGEKFPKLQRLGERHLAQSRLLQQFDDDINDIDFDMLDYDNNQGEYLDNIASNSISGGLNTPQENLILQPMSELAPFNYNLSDYDFIASLMGNNRFARESPGELSTNSSINWEGWNNNNNYNNGYQNNDFFDNNGLLGSTKYESNSTHSSTVDKLNFSGLEKFKIISQVLKLIDTDQIKLSDASIKELRFVQSQILQDNTRDITSSLNL